MNSHMKRIRKFLVQNNTQDLPAILRLAYDLYENRGDGSGEIQRCNQALGEHLSSLDFEEQDSICSAVNALCAAYDFAAFTEGFQRGAQLILALLCSDE